MTIDTTIPSIARVYDCFLGGKDHFAVDRKVYNAILDLAPEAPALAVAGRHFLARVVTYLAVEAGVDQFLDLGCGLPSADNTHQVVQRCTPYGRVVYVDNDPDVAAQARGMLNDNPVADFAVADLRDVTGVLGHRTVRSALDLTRPIALMQAGTLHHLNDHEEPARIMRAYVDALPRGSYVVLTHFYNPADDGPQAELASRLERRFQAALGTSRFRTHEQISSLIEGLEVLPANPLPGAPGIVPVREWWPPGPLLRQPRPMDNLFVGALARKPH